MGREGGAMKGEQGGGDMWSERVSVCSGGRRQLRRTDKFYGAKNVKQERMAGVFTEQR